MLHKIMKHYTTTILKRSTYFELTIVITTARTDIRIEVRPEIIGIDVP